MAATREIAQALFAAFGLEPPAQTPPPADPSRFPLHGNRPPLDVGRLLAAGTLIPTNPTRR